jgi:hypothetical protein
MSPRGTLNVRPQLLQVNCVAGGPNLRGSCRRLRRLTLPQKRQGMRRTNRTRPLPMILGASNRGFHVAGLWHILRRKRERHTQGEGRK